VKSAAGPPQHIMSDNEDDYDVPYYDHFVNVNAISDTRAISTAWQISQTDVNFAIHTRDSGSETQMRETDVGLQNLSLTASVPSEIFQDLIWEG
jgi:hypothetical protein